MNTHLVIVLSLVTAIPVVAAPGEGGATSNKVSICHYDDAGVPHEITLNKKAAAAHFDSHGDYDLITFYQDSDGDAFGDANTSTATCLTPAGFVANSADCDDTDSTVFPSSTEVCGDSIDNDCSGTADDTCFPTHQCDAGQDPGTGAAWVVCQADADTAWISANNFGRYHPELICQQLGYATVSQWGGTFGSVCGIDQDQASCSSLGSRFFSEGSWNGGTSANCGTDELGPIICNTVMWECVQ